VADTLTPAERSERMSRVRSKGNRQTELRLIELMRERRITGWRRGAKLLGRPDFVWWRERIALFVDGCFWHGCPKHARVPKSKLDFWAPKLIANKARDRKVNRGLRRAGWRILRIWECALSPRRARLAIARLERILQLPLPGDNHPTVARSNTRNLRRQN
jgi:DNA mismatch endonuclease (patch repair protein)